MQKSIPKAPPVSRDSDALQRLSRPAAARLRLSPHGQLLPRTALMLGQKGNSVSDFITSLAITTRDALCWD